MKIALFIFILFTFQIESKETKKIDTKIKYGSMSGIVSVSRSGQKKEANDVVVYVTGYEESAISGALKLEQKDRKFAPTVSVVTRGQQVEFINRDKIKHNVFSMSKARQFDIGEMDQDQVGTVEFQKTGIVDLYCNIHPNMNGSLLVVPNRAFAITNKNGEYQIDKIPVGEYNVFAWHALGNPVKQLIKITEGQMETVNWEVSLTKDEAPHLNKEGKPYLKTPSAIDY
jgi:plastocyanin